MDPTGRREILSYAEKLKRRGKTIALVSHNMDEAARYADRILVLKKGQVRALMTPAERSQIHSNHVNSASAGLRP